MKKLPGKFRDLIKAFRGAVPRKEMFCNLLLSSLIALGILVADYYLSNISFPIFDSSTDLALQAYFRDYKTDDDVHDEIITVNTANDKALAVEYDDIFRRELGTVAVSDRRKITEFLNIVADADYRYIFLDLRFEEHIVTTDDSALYSLISTMPRLLFSRHRSAEATHIADADSKGAYADFRTMLGAGFSRYEFLQDGHESVALRMFSDMTGRNIRPTALGGYRDTDGSLCYNMQFVPFPIAATQKYASDGRVKYQFLGSQVLGQHTPDELRSMVKDKVIIIGDFDNDRHDTYIGSVAGPLLTIYAWNLLKHDGHKVNYALQFFLLLFYTTVIFIMLLPDEKKSISNPFISLILSLLGWGALLWLLKSMMYWLFGLSFMVIIPVTVFSLINFFRNTITVITANKEKVKKLLAKGFGRVKFFA